MSFYSHYVDGKFIEMKDGPTLEIDFSKLNLKLGQTIVDSKLRNKGGNSFGNLFVTSGLLTSKLNGVVSVANTNTHNFRVLIDYYDEFKSKVAWKNSTICCTVRINHLLQNGSTIPDWSGFHLFSRYKTENDLYVASVRIDGNVVIKKKKGGEYKTLGTKKIEKRKINEVFSMQFVVFDNETNITNTNHNTTTWLSLYVNDQLVLNVEDKTDIITNGTNGIRTDYCDVDIFSILLK